MVRFALRNGPYRGVSKMGIKEYFKHARSLGAFTATECLSMARQAAELDRKAEIASVSQPTLASYEVMPDGSGFIKLSDSVKVY